jgi:hypothetical protein
MGGWIDSVGDAGYFVAVVGANLFVILYLVLARFWRSGSGWHIFSFMVVIALILNHSVVSIYFPHYPGRDVVRAILYPLLAAVIFWRVVILLFVQTEKFRKKQLLEPERPDVDIDVK